MWKKILAIILTITTLLSMLAVTSSATYSLKKSDGVTDKNNAYLRGNKTAIIYVPGYRCTNLSRAVTVNGEEKEIVCFPVGTDLFSVNDSNSGIVNFIHGAGNLLVSAFMLLFAQVQCDDLVVSPSGSFGLADIYRDFFDKCIAKYGDKCDVIIYDFDWRTDLCESSKDLHDLIQTQKYNKVIMVTQSMGGLVASGAAKLLWDDKQDNDRTNDVEVYTVNMGSTVLGSYDYYVNAESYEGIKKFSIANLSYLSETNFITHSQLAVPVEYATLLGGKYASAKIEKADGTVAYEKIDPQTAFNDLVKVCDHGENLLKMEKFYNTCIFIDNDNNPETRKVHIMEELGDHSYYVAGFGYGAPTEIQVNYIEDSAGNRTAVSCTEIESEDLKVGDGSILLDSSTMCMCSPKTTFLMPYSHQNVYFHEDSQYLMYDILTHIIESPETDFDYTASGHQYKDLYPAVTDDCTVQCESYLYHQVAKYIFGLLGVDISMDTAANIYRAIEKVLVALKIL